MFIKMLEILLILAVFLPVRYLAYYITEVKGLPEWLDYKPWNCKLCLTFWSLIAVYVSAGVIGLQITMIGGIILAILNAIAMWIDQKNKTVTLEEYDSMDNEKTVDCDEIQIEDDNIIVIKDGEVIDINDYQ